MKGAHVVVQDGSKYSPVPPQFGVIYDPNRDYLATDWTFPPCLTREQARALAGWLDSNPKASFEEMNQFLGIKQEAPRQGGYYEH